MSVMSNRMNVNVQDALVGLKREAYALLDQALTQDTMTSSRAVPSRSDHDSCIVLYERSLASIERALVFYKEHERELGHSPDSSNIASHLAAMRKQAKERLALLHSQPMSSAPSDHTVDQDEFLDMGEAILADHEFVIIDEDVATKKITTNQPGHLFPVIEEATKPATPMPVPAVPVQTGSKRINQEDFAKASEICRFDNGVQMFYISDDGTVSTPSTPITMSVYSFQKNDGGSLVGFIRVGEWVYPLVPEGSPAMKTNFNAYIFPNEENETVAKAAPKCSFVGLTFAAPIDTNQASLFEDVLANYAALIYQDKNQESGVKVPYVPSHQGPSSGSQLEPAAVMPKPQVKPQAKPIYPPAPFELSHQDPRIAGEKAKAKSPEASASAKQAKEAEAGLQPRYPVLEETRRPSLEDEESVLPGGELDTTASRIARGLLTGAEYVARGVGVGSEYASSLMTTGGEHLKSRLTPAVEPTHVDPKLKSAMQGVRYGTHATVRVSGFLLNKLGWLAKKTAEAAAPHIRSGSTAILHKTGIAGSGNSANNTVDNVCTLAHGGIQSFGVVYDSLEGAAKTLSKNFANHTVTVVEHKYGPEMSKVAENGLYSVGNIALSANNINNLKVVRTLAKTTAKEVLLQPHGSKRIEEARDSAYAKKLAAVEDTNPNKKH